MTFLGRRSYAGMKATLLWLKKTKNRILLLLFALLGGAMAFGANFLIDLLYDSELAIFISKPSLFVLIMLPALLIVITAYILLRIVGLRLMHRSGTLLQFRVIGMFAFSLGLILFTFIVLFNGLFDIVSEVFDSSAALEKLESSLEEHAKSIDKLIDINEEDLTYRLAEKDFVVGNEDFIDVFMIFNKNKTPIHISRKQGLRLRSYPSFSRIQDSINDEILFSSYSEDRYFVYTLYVRSFENNVKYLYASLRFVDKELRQNISSTLKVVRELKQFEFIAGPFKNIILFAMIYISIQLFCLAIILFYYRFNVFVKPISDLIDFAKKIPEIAEAKRARSNYGHEARLTRHLKNVKKNELGELIRNILQMSRILRANRQKLSEAQELKGWREATVRIAHEIRNPLTPITLSVGEIKDHVAKMSFSSYEKLNDSFTLIEQELSRIDLLIKDLSEVSKKKKLQKKIYPAKKILKKAQSFAAGYKDVEVHVALHAPEASVLVDMAELYRVFVNLIKNSVESYETSSLLGPGSHVPKKQRKRIYLEAETLKDGVKEYLEFRVADHGSGIKEGLKEKIFLPYVTTKREGTGLGLSICRQIIALHYGSIFLKEEGHGDDAHTKKKMLSKKPKHRRTCMAIRLPLVSVSASSSM